MNLHVVAGRFEFAVEPVSAGIGLAFCVGEVFGLFALFTVWVDSGFGRFMDRPFWVRANNLLTGQYMELVTNAIQFFVGFEFKLVLEDDPGGAHLLFARHAGPGDALRLMKIVFRARRTPASVVTL